MVAIVYKWLMVFALLNAGSFHHPIFLSVTEIEHNPKTQGLEISCKIYTDDFETALRKIYNTKVDLIDVKYKTPMNTVVNDYIQKHFAVKVDGKTVQLNFLGFEQQEEGIVSFYEAKNVAKVTNLEVTNNILYEFKEQQIGIIHVTVGGSRKSTRLDNPTAKATFTFP